MSLLMMLRLFSAIAALALQGCVLTQQNFIRNDTDSAMVVSVQGERRDLGWPRKEMKTVSLPAHTICSVRHDIFFDAFLYIENLVTGRSTNISAIKNDNYIYSVSEADGRQVVTIAEADSKAERLLEGWDDQCVKIER